MEPAAGLSMSLVLITPPPVPGYRPLSSNFMAKLTLSSNEPGAWMNRFNTRVWSSGLTMSLAFKAGMIYSSSIVRL